MIDHLTLTSANYEKSKNFYQAALEPLGYKLVKEFDSDVAGFGVGDRLDFWLANDSQKTHPIFHLAFVAETRAQVDEFYQAALAAGGRIMAPQDSGKNMAPPIMRPSSMIQMDKISKLSVGTKLVRIPWHMQSKTISKTYIF